jgi:hypothetical protein
VSQVLQAVDKPTALESAPAEWAISGIRAAAPHRARLLLVLIALGAILIGNFLTRRYLERWQHVSYFELAGTTNAGVLAKGWRLLLPINTSQDQYCWCTTGSVVVVALEQLTSPRTTFCLLNGLLIVVTFWTSWLALRSATFTLTMTLGMAFGTQLHYAYALSSIYAFYLFLSYLSINLLCALKLLVGHSASRSWGLLYLVSLLLMALCHETWLNYCVFLWIAGGFLYLYIRKYHRPCSVQRLLFVVGSATLLACVYIPIKVHYGRQHFRAGAEDEIILGYAHFSLAADDFVSNVITYNYMAFTNYVPPPFLSSFSDYFHNNEVIRSEQHGYHPQLANLVETHHLLFWRYQAGAVFCAFLYLLVKASTRALRGGSPRWACVAILLLPVATGSATHDMIKFRPYLSVPSLSYKCLISIFGVTLLISYLLMIAQAHFRRSWLRRSLIALMWSTILVAAALRPAYLSHLNTLVGLGGYPDPLQGVYRLWNR